MANENNTSDSQVDVGRVLTDSMVRQIRDLFVRYPNRQAVTLPALHIVHEELRHVPLQAVVEIAELLELTPADVQDALSFYGFFKQDKPHGRTRVWVCRSISCALRGSEEIAQHLCDRLGMQPGETTADNSVTLEVAECLGACDFAPCFLAGSRLHRNMTRESADRLLDELTTDGDRDSV
ncbi:MAG: NAD(P)H-dependent oxidoreductase subunit E [Planctomycetaceae bacterium]|jgi:NADH-quinone oxidoreductase subunit E|nr:NAD(P)H-dependent oxidoreductase subunit E [Planctomycetaceae bacterium]MBP60366.1 NAD(P)H-dependent oxidoreductase subunit E [Planctomycetaceae bacterium]